MTLPPGTATLIAFVAAASACARPPSRIRFAATMARTWGDKITPVRPGKGRGGNDGRLPLDRVTIPWQDSAGWSISYGAARARAPGGPPMRWHPWGVRPF
jgi:hypothetical protein